MPLPGPSFTAPNTSSLGQISPNQDGLSGILAVGGAGALAVGRYTAAQDIYDAAATATVTISEAVRYHIDGYFAMNPGGVLYFEQVTTTCAQATIVDMQMSSAVKGRMRQLLVCGEEPDTATLADWIDEAGAAAEELFTEKKPLVVLVTPDPTFSPVVASTGPLVTNDPTLDDGTRFVGVVIFGDADAKESDGSTALPERAGGFVLGAMAASPRVSSKTGWVGSPIPSFTTGTRFINVNNGDVNADSLRQADYTAIDALHVIYAFAQNLPNGQVGYYPGDDWSLASANSDYNLLTRGRIVQKALRIADEALTPFTNRDWQLTAAGRLAQSDIDILVSAVNNALNAQMITAGEISDNRVTDSILTNLVYVDPDQNVLSTNSVAYTLNIIPAGYSKAIPVTLRLTNPNTTA